MLALVKIALRIATTVYDSELLALMSAAVADISHVGAEFEVTEVKDAEQTVIDYTITDPLIRDAVIMYVKLYFGSPDDFDRLKAAYDEKKGQLRESSAYGMIDLNA